MALEKHKLLSQEKKRQSTNIINNSLEEKARGCLLCFVVFWAAMRLPLQREWKTLDKH